MSESIDDFPAPRTSGRVERADLTRLQGTLQQLADSLSECVVELRRLTAALESAPSAATVHVEAPEPVMEEAPAPTPPAAAPGPPAAIEPEGPNETDREVRAQRKIRTDEKPRIRAVWEPLPLDELDALRLQIEGEIQALRNDTLADLARLKAVSARFTALSLQRTRHPGSQELWHDLLTTLRGRKKELWPERYCLIAGPDTTSTPAEAEALAEKYLMLAELQPVVDALQPLLHLLKPREGARLGLQVQAMLSLMSTLRTKMVGKEMDQQCADLRDWASKLGPGTLPAETEALEKLAAGVPEAARDLLALLRNRQDLDESVGEVKAAAAAGLDDEASIARLLDAARVCLTSGERPSSVRLREILLPVADLLEEEPGLEVLHRELLQARERREKSEPPDDQEILVERDPELARQIEELLLLTAGRRALMLGGVPKSVPRERIQEILKLEELEWPEMRTNDRFEKWGSQIRRADVLFLNRFNRKRTRAARPLCKESNTLYVPLPKGYGPAHVVQQAYKFLVEGQMDASQSDDQPGER